MRLVVPDDSTIKGNTDRVLADKLWAAGALEVHFRHGAPRYISPCNLGMDTRDPQEFVARNGRSDAEIAVALHATSVAFNSFEAVEQAIDAARMRPDTPSLLGKFCRGCTMGEYPITIPESLQVGQRKLLGVNVLTHS
jgi:glutamine phosphoribosylpyrophosphate amidotransferase